MEMERAAGNLGSRPGKVGTNPEFMGMERETGLEPATPCLEGRYLLFFTARMQESPLNSALLA